MLFVICKYKSSVNCKLGLPVNSVLPIFQMLSLPIVSYFISEDWFYIAFLKMVFSFSSFYCSICLIIIEKL